MPSKNNIFIIVCGCERAPGGMSVLRGGINGTELGAGIVFLIGCFAHMQIYLKLGD